MEEPLFYTAGLVLVATALVVSAIGLRDEGFPAGPAFRAVAGLLAVLVAATVVGAVLSARDEQDHRRHDEAYQRELKEFKDGLEPAAAQSGGGSENGGAAQ